MTTQIQPSLVMRGFWWRLGSLFSGGLVLVLVFGLVLWFAGRSARSNLVKQYPAPGQLTDVGGYKLYLNCAGQGTPTVVMEAGINDFSLFWARVQPEVARFARVCTYDRAGFGWSEPGPNPRTSRLMVQELHTLLVNATVEKPYILVGHSFGGALVRLFAHAYPDEVAGMVLVDAAHEELFRRIPAWSKAVEQGVRQFRALAPLQSLGLMALWPTTIPNRGLPDSVLAHYRAIVATTGYFETASAETESFEKNLAEIAAAHINSLGNLPLIVLSRGYWEPLPGLSEAENQRAWQEWQAMQSELAALSANSEQVIAEQSGHDIQLQQPAIVIEAIQRMVQATRYGQDPPVAER